MVHGVWTIALNLEGCVTCISCISSHLHLVCMLVASVVSGP
jgi:hypothetical protein